MKKVFFVLLCAAGALVHGQNGQQIPKSGNPLVVQNDFGFVRHNSPLTQYLILDTGSGQALEKGKKKDCAPFDFYFWDDFQGGVKTPGEPKKK